MDLAELLSKKESLAEMEKIILKHEEEFDFSIKDLRDERDRVKAEYTDALRAELTDVDGTALRMRAARGSVPKPNTDRIVEAVRGSSEPIAVDVIRHLAGISDDVSSTTMSVTLKGLVDAGLLHKEGTHRGTKYTA